LSCAGEGGIKPCRPVCHFSDFSSFRHCITVFRNTRFEAIWVSTTIFEHITCGINAVIEHIRAAGLHEHVSVGAERVIIGAVGDERVLNVQVLEQMPEVERAVRIVHDWRIISREAQPQNSVYVCRGVALGQEVLHIDIKRPVNAKTIAASRFETPIGFVLLALHPTHHLAAATRFSSSWRGLWANALCRAWPSTKGTWHRFHRSYSKHRCHYNARHCESCATPLEPLVTYPNLTS